MQHRQESQDCDVPEGEWGAVLGTPLISAWQGGCLQSPGLRSGFPGPLLFLLRSGAPEAEAEVEVHVEVMSRELFPEDPHEGALAEAEEGCIFR